MGVGTFIRRVARASRIPVGRERSGSCSKIILCGAKQPQAAFFSSAGKNTAVSKP